ncbi:MAG TPA: CHAD domain-containing protein [Anaerolineaceae bacterium]
MPKEIDQGTKIYAAEVMLKHLQALEVEVDGVLHSADIEYIHRMRVATRRLRSAMQVFKLYLPARRIEKWTQGVRSITQALGEARDTDVQLALLAKFQQKVEEPRLKPGLNRLALRLRQQRAILQTQVVQALMRFQEEGIAVQMQERLAPIAAQAQSVYVFTPMLYQHAHDAIQDRLEEFLSYEIYIPQPERITELHTMRIFSKRLRYTLEIFAPLFSSGLKTPLQVVRNVQEALGDIHDCDVWVAFLPQFMEAEHQRMQAYFGHTAPFNRLRPGIEAFLENRRQSRDKTYEGFVSDWEKWKERGVWNELRTTIQVPFLKISSVYPPAPPSPVEPPASPLTA